MSKATLIDGKSIAKDLADETAVQSKRYEAAIGATPCLAVVLVGDDPASAVYVRNKGRMADMIGFRSLQRTLPTETSEAELVDLVTALNSDPSVNGILVQLPLPAHINASKILDLIDPAKDVDGFHPLNVGRLAAGQLDKALLPCTPAGSVILVKTALGDDLAGRHAVIVGRSNIVGKPAAHLLLAENCTITIAHSRTRDIASVVREADIVVAAVGRAEMIKGDWIKPGATVIDVGINRVAAPEKGEGKTKLVGDVEFESASAIAGAITPVPGGVGPMTIAMLMKNTLTAACRQNNISL
jgi:methylenetetrahydrofolate dehydrogenase (NADP+) / methenyltetrahydrofolate cyclohydrolase